MSAVIAATKLAQWRGGGFGLEPRVSQGTTDSSDAMGEAGSAEPPSERVGEGRGGLPGLCGPSPIDGRIDSGAG